MIKKITSSLIYPLILSLFLLTAGLQAGEQPLITFNYDNEELVDVIDQIGQATGANIIMPTGANAVTSKITIHMDTPLTIKQAWQMLTTVVDLAGYSLIPKKESFYTLVKTSKAVTKEVIPLYVGMEPDKLPDTDQRIRFLYYLTNIKVSDALNDTNVIHALFKELLPENYSAQFDTKVNAVLLTEKASNVKAVMAIVAALDKTTEQEKVEVIKLRYTSGDVIAKLFTDILKKPNAPPGGFGIKPQQEDNSFFSDQVKIIPDLRTNKIIVVGKDQAVSRVAEFINKYIDVEMESGQSVLHVYQLLYLDAASFAPILQKIVTSERAGGAGQSTATGAKVGVDRFFEGVIIRSDQPQGGSKDQIYGSNKLIIAAKNDDWIHIKRLVEQLDKPQPQVILEVMIADLTIDDLRQLGASTRNPAGIPLGFGIQGANEGLVVAAPQMPAGTLNPPPVGVATNVNRDLLANVIATSSGFRSIADLTGANQAGREGSTLISLNDPVTGETWSLLQFLERFTTAKILSHPHVIAINNQTASVSVGEQRLVPGETVGTAASAIIKFDQIKADLKVTIKPRISASNNVNLQINIDITEFVSASTTNNTRVTRQIITNAYVQSQDVLALGGLLRTSTVESQTEVPILAKIPILGWFFKKRSSENLKTNLTVFISPTVVQPRLRGGIDKYTTEYVQLNERYVREAEIFDSLRDPVTRFFFGANPDVTEAINGFLATDELKRQETLLKMPTEASEVRTVVETPKRRRRRSQHQIITSAEQLEQAEAEQKAVVEQIKKQKGQPH